MTAWAHLPNAKHIDDVLAHAKAHPDKWVAAWAAAWGAARPAAWDAAWDAAWGAVRGASRAAAWDAAWAAARDAVRGAAWDAVWAAVRGACLALIAWDDTGVLMDAPVDAVRTLAAAGHHPAVLILPARLAMTEEL